MIEEDVTQTRIPTDSSSVHPEGEIKLDEEDQADFENPGPPPTGGAAWYTVAAAASLLHCSERTIARHISTRKLTSVVQGGMRLVKVDLDEATALRDESDDAEEKRVHVESPFRATWQTPEDAAVSLGMAKSTINTFVRQGKLRAQRIGGRRHVLVELPPADSLLPRVPQAPPQRRCHKQRRRVLGPGLLTTKQAGRRIGRSCVHVADLCRMGTIKATMMGRGSYWAVDEGSLSAYMEEKLVQHVSDRKWPFNVKPRSVHANGQWIPPDGCMTFDAAANELGMSMTTMRERHIATGDIVAEKLMLGRRPRWSINAESVQKLKQKLAAGSVAEVEACRVLVTPEGTDVDVDLDAATEEAIKMDKAMALPDGLRDLLTDAMQAGDALAVRVVALEGVDFVGHSSGHRKIHGRLSELEIRLNTLLRDLGEKMMNLPRQQGMYEEYRADEDAELLESDGG